MREQKLRGEVLLKWGQASTFLLPHAQKPISIFSVDKFLVNSLLPSRGASRPLCERI